MLTFKHRVKPIKTVFAYLLLILVTWSLIGCSDRLESKNLSNPQDSITTNQFNRLAEVAPPPLIQQLDSFLSRYQPQVSIISPLPDQLFTENKVEIKLALKDLPIFQDYQLNLGPYLQLILDNDTYLSIYDLDQPIILEDLTPGTHTIRVFAAKPWRESFKNEGAYTQAKFHIYTQTDNSPDTSLPLLTYNAPQGNYGAEPIMLDFYLTNAPLRFVARQNPEDAIGDWRIKVTINDESFLLDSWKPIYLTGFQPGTNWVKLEFLDGQGKRIDNLFNTKVALIDYQPKGQDSLSQLIRGELTADVAQSIVDPDYLVPSVPAIEITPDTPEVIETSPDSPEVIETTPDIPEISPDSPEVIE
ncbi:hypothetical protein, partial [Gloeocapsa sp. PCC 73106]|uniref:hypothetical protein n=1 Tax=Gloeocapsa sp. PCC 73106 TaxID=102232 RepID=UPI0002AC1596